MPTFSGNGDSATYAASEGDVTIFASGDFGGGTLAVQTYGSDASWHTVASISANSYSEFKNSGRNDWRVSLSGATAPTLWYEVR